MFKPGDDIQWAVHRHPTLMGAAAADRVEVGFKNLTRGEAHVLLQTLNRLQLYRATGVDAADVEGNSK